MFCIYPLFTTNDRFGKRWLSTMKGDVIIKNSGMAELMTGEIL